MVMFWIICPFLSFCEWDIKETCWINWSYSFSNILKLSTSKRSALEKAHLYFQTTAIKSASAPYLRGNARVQFNKSDDFGGTFKLHVNIAGVYCTQTTVRWRQWLIHAAGCVGQAVTLVQQAMTMSWRDLQRVFLGYSLKWLIEKQKEDRYRRTCWLVEWWRNWSGDKDGDGGI